MRESTVVYSSFAGKLISTDPGTDRGIRACDLGKRDAKGYVQPISDTSYDTCTPHLTLVLASLHIQINAVVRPSCKI